MNRAIYCLVALAASCALAPAAWAQGGRERTLCEGDGCTDNTMRVTFGDATADGADPSTFPSTLVIPAPTTDKEFMIAVQSDVREEGVQGWSMGVAHDPTKIEILSVTLDGLTLPDIFFETTVPAVPRPGSPGFVSAVVLAIFPPPGAILPIAEDTPIVRATYKVLVELPDDVDEFLQFSDMLVPNDGSPPTGTNFTISSATKKPRTVTDGIVKGGVVNGGDCAGYWLEFGPGGNQDANETVELTGTTATMSIQNVPKAALGFSFGVSVTDNGSTYTIVNEGLGMADDRLVEVVITDIDGGSNTPMFNSAVRNEDPKEIESITKGAAIADVEGDFFTVDLQPDVGGPGFTVGYVVDVTGNDATIPATAAQGDPCPTNEVIVISYGVIPGGCPDDVAGMHGLFFGPNATTDDFAIAAGADQMPVTMRNPNEALGFSFGATTVDGNMNFADRTLGAVAGREVANIITDIDGTSQVPVTNSASGQTADIQSIVKGAAIADIMDDFITVDLAPAVGGPGFTVGYVADVTGTEASIPATPSSEDACPVNEILLINFGVDGDGPFRRGDTDGNGMLNVSDGAISAQNIFLNRIKFFECDEMLDSDNDDDLDTVDVILILQWVFLGGDDLAEPFLMCGFDTADDTLDCMEPNCTIEP